MSKTKELDVRRETDLDIMFNRADHIITKDFLNSISLLPIVKPALPMVKEKRLVNGTYKDETRTIKASDQASFFRIDKLVYDSEENNLQKLTNVYSALSSIGANAAIVIVSDGKDVEFYLGVCGEDDRNRVRPNAEALYNFVVGNFPGSLGEYDKISQDNDEINNFVLTALDNNSISAVSAVASVRSEEIDENEKFNQGIEKLLDTMRGKPFSAIFIANSVSSYELADIRAEYELLYSSLVPFAKNTMTYNDSQSDGVTKTLSDSFSDTVGKNSSTALSVGTTKTTSHTEGESKTHTDTVGTSSGTNFGVKGEDCSIGVHNSVHYSHSYARTKSFSDTTSFGTTNTKTTTEGTSQAHTVTKTSSDGTTSTYTYGKALQLNYENKSVTSLLEKIDAQLERIKNSESFGMFATAAYFLAPNKVWSEMAASAYKSIISGTNTALEIAAINTWTAEEDISKIREYLSVLHHPEFALDDRNTVTPASLVSAQELAIQMGLPKKSVSGVTVIQTAAFGRNICKTDGEDQNSPSIKIGSLYHMGAKDESTSIALDVNSFASHTFVTGSTGSGKSNTVYQLLHRLRKRNVKFLVVEPAKGEYKNIFGHKKNDVSVYGTNPKTSDILRINPFSFPKNIHIYEHMDRLVEIFNVCWPMYAAMPAVLKDAIERAYVESGWDLETSENKYNDRLFPTFADVLDQIDVVMEASQYSANSKGDYKGALSTRIKSLTNGINSLIFTSNELTNEELFEKNVIADLSRVGSTETKALIMGILVMKLSEYHMSGNGMNQPLKHVTVLEEAHNLLKRTSTEQSAEGSNLLGKSVEMLTNSIAEMRTYGEGFIIADQAPGLLDMSAIRNTNTKIVLRLPEQSDRELVGKAMGLSDNQINELSKLERGVAAIYQNNWLEAVLCKVEYFKSDEKLFVKDGEVQKNNALSNKLFLAFAKNKHEMVDFTENEIVKSCISGKTKASIFRYMRASAEEKGKCFAEIAYNFFNAREVFEAAMKIKNPSRWAEFIKAELQPSIEELTESEANRIIKLIAVKEVMLHREHEQFLREMLKGGNVL